MTTQETAQQDVNGTVLTDEQAPLLKPTPEQIAEYLADASHDELNAIPYIMRDLDLADSFFMLIGCPHNHGSCKRRKEC
ncbi:hypothetical protein LCGC14_2546910 [marine sediment metagenome]|uniref:Uncharacterized protein n=1 Tax=marine sediment metagenome TaxID=412755 RepID=A0A0F9BBV5_9ZZZZ